MLLLKIALIILGSLIVYFSGCAVFYTLMCKFRGIPDRIDEGYCSTWHSNPGVTTTFWPLTGVFQLCIGVGYLIRERIEKQERKRVRLIKQQAQLDAELNGLIAEELKKLEHRKVG